MAPCGTAVSTWDVSLGPARTLACGAVMVSVLAAPTGEGRNQERSNRQTANQRMAHSFIHADGRLLAMGNRTNLVDRAR